MGTYVIGSNRHHFIRSNSNVGITVLLLLSLIEIGDLM
jgi:hypothetical protein